MSLQIKTSGLGPTAYPKLTPPRKIHRRALSTTSTLSSTPSDPPPRPQTISPNRNAWVLTLNGKYSMCNTHSRFTTLTPITPLPTTANTTALGIGTVTLRTRLRNGKVTPLTLTDVLFVPDNVVSTIVVHTLPGGARFDAAEGGVVRDARRRQLAWFPRSKLTTAGLFCLRLAGEWDRLFPADAPAERKPSVCALCLVQGEVVERRDVAESDEEEGQEEEEEEEGQEEEEEEEDDEEESDEDDGMDALLDWATPAEDREFVREHWGSRLMFQITFGLKMDPEDLEEGDAILKVLQQPEPSLDDSDGSSSEDGYIGLLT